MSLVQFQSLTKRERLTYLRDPMSNEHRQRLMNEMYRRMLENGIFALNVNKADPNA